MPEKGLRLEEAKRKKYASCQWLNIDRHTLVKLGMLAGLGIVLLVAGQLVKSPETVKAPSGSPPSAIAVQSAHEQTRVVSYKETLEQQLAITLSHIKGAGQVLVQVSLEGGNRFTYATNRKEEGRNTEEKAPTGTVHLSEEKRVEAQVVMAREGNAEQPIVVEEVLPTVRGVLVIAEGAKDPYTKEDLSQSVQVLLGLPAHKVKVLERED